MRKTTDKDQRLLGRLARKYFDGTATEDQEARLRSLLAFAPATDDADVEAARAVMGFVAREKARALPRRRTAPPRRRLGWGAFTAGAAAAAVAALLLMPASGVAPVAGDDCRAFVGGKPVDDHALVMNMVQDDWEEISDAQDGLQESLDDQISTMLSTIEE